MIMIGRAKEILAYSAVLFIFLYVWQFMQLSTFMGSGRDWIPDPTLSLMATSLVTGLFFDRLMDYTGLSAVKTAMTIGAVRILFYDVFGIMGGTQSASGAIVDIIFTLSLSYTAGKTYERVSRKI